jgi:hypothetical protein
MTDTLMLKWLRGQIKATRKERRAALAARDYGAAAVLHGMIEAYAFAVLRVRQMRARG